MPPLCLGRSFKGSKGEWFHKNLNSKEVKVLSYLGEGRMILDKKRIFERRCWLREITLEKIDLLG